MPRDVTYDDLYSLVSEEIEKKLRFSSVSKFGEQLRRTNLTPFEGQEQSEIASAESLDEIIQLLHLAIPSTIISGLEVTAIDPISDRVDISAGTGIVGEHVYTLKNSTSVQIPFDIYTSVFYLVLYNNSLFITKTLGSDQVKVAKIVVPQPGVTNLIQDHRDTSWNAYIVNYKEYKLYGMNDLLEEDSIDLLRNNISKVLADNLIGNIRLSEDLKIINTQGSLELNSKSLIFFDINNNELAYFGADKARIGNILITPTTMQSGNYTPNASGFVIQDNGDCEFNNIRLRGTLYTSTIAENLFINPGIRFIGDLNLDDSLFLLAGEKIVFDRNLSSDTYWTYNSATSYLEGWIDGTLRIEL